MAGGSANDYEYCLGDPVNCTDLDGRVSRSKPKTTSEVFGALYLAISYLSARGLSQIERGYATIRANCTCSTSSFEQRAGADFGRAIGRGMVEDGYARVRLAGALYAAVASVQYGVQSCASQYMSAECGMLVAGAAVSALNAMRPSLPGSTVVEGLAVVGVMTTLIADAVSDLRSSG